jgi:hypothetical protein
LPGVEMLDVLTFVLFLCVLIGFLRFVQRDLPRD